MKKFKKRIASVLTAAAISASSIAAGVTGVSLTASAADENYMEALAMSLYFYDSNACGSDITGGPLTWRGD